MSDHYVGDDCPGGHMHPAVQEQIEHLASERDLAREELRRAKDCIRNLIEWEAKLHHGNVEAAGYAKAWAEAARIVIS